MIDILHAIGNTSLLCGSREHLRAFVKPPGADNYQLQLLYSSTGTTGEINPVETLEYWLGDEFRCDLHQEFAKTGANTIVVPANMSGFDMILPTDKLGKPYPAMTPWDHPTRYKVDRPRVSSAPETV